MAGTLMGRLGLEALIDGAVRPAGAGRGSGAKVLSLVASMLVGGACIDDADRLRAASAGAVLAFRGWPRRLWGRFCGPSPSAMSASSTALMGRRLGGRGLWARRPLWRR